MTVERLLPDVFKDPRRNSHIPDTALDNIIDIKRQSKRLSLSDHNPESTPISSALESESLVSDIGDGTDSYGFDMNKFRYLRVEDWSTETKISIISFTPNQEWKAIAAKLRPLIFCEISSEVIRLIVTSDRCMDSFF